MEKSALDLGKVDRESEFLNFGRDVLVDQLPSSASPSEAPGMGMPIQSLFIGLLLSAMASVLIREVYWRDNIDAVDSRWVIGSVVGGMVLGGLVSMITCLIYRLGLLQTILRSLVGVTIGGIGASSVLLSASSVRPVLMTIAFGAILLVGAGALTFRWRLNAEGDSAT